MNFAIPLKWFEKKGKKLGHNLESWKTVERENVS